MEIVIPQEFFRILKDKYLLLDTNVFIDAFHNPTKFAEFFNQLSDNETTLVTIDPVIIEFTRGSSNETTFEEKKKFLHEIIDAVIPVDQKIIDSTIKLIKKYAVEGKSVSIVDFLLGGMIAKFKGKMFLMTKDIKDFPTNIFELKSYLNIMKRKSIHNYGIYVYNKP